MSFATLVQQNYYTLTQSEKKVADYILVTGPEIVFQTMGEIKKHIRVGDATIIRFCQKLGFSGFSDLKIEIAKEDLNKGERLLNEDDYLKHVSPLMEMIKLTAANLDKVQVKDAVKLIAQAKHIYIFGVGGSGHSSCELESMFLRVGVKAQAVTDPHYQAQLASILTQDDVVIAFSLSGKTIDVLDAVVTAKNNQAKVIVVTTYLHSPLAQQGDIVLKTSVDEFLNGGSLVGKLSQQVVCDLLVWEYEQTQNIDTISLREKVLRSILNKRTDP